MLDQIYKYREFEFSNFSLLLVIMAEITTATKWLISNYLAKKKKTTKDWV